MSQAEIAGVRMTLSGELPSKGHRFPDFELTGPTGGPVQLSDYRGRLNLVLVFIDEGEAARKLLGELAGRYAEVRSQQAEILAVAQTSGGECARLKAKLDLPYAILPDEDGRIHREAGAGDGQGRQAAAVYVTDRYGEIFAVYRTLDGQALPAADDILSWLAFINIQCPECEPPEWPI